MLTGGGSLPIWRLEGRGERIGDGVRGSLSEEHEGEGEGQGPVIMGMWRVYGALVVCKGRRGRWSLSGVGAVDLAKAAASSLSGELCEPLRVAQYPTIHGGAISSLRDILRALSAPGGGKAAGEATYSALGLCALPARITDDRIYNGVPSTFFGGGSCGSALCSVPPLVFIVTNSLAAVVVLLLGSGIEESPEKVRFIFRYAAPSTLFFAVGEEYTSAPEVAVEVPTLPESGFMMRRGGGNRLGCRERGSGVMGLPQVSTFGRGSSIS